MCSPQSQRSLRESQGALLEKVEELTEQLKQERQRALALEGQLTTSTMSLQTLDKVLHLYLHVIILTRRDQRSRHLLSLFLFKGFILSLSATREDIRPGGRERSNKRKL